MAAFLRHQESTVRYDKNHMGWVWGFLHLFDFHHHLHVRKMLTDRKHSYGRHSEGAKITNLKQNAPQPGEEHELLLSEADISMEDKLNVKSKSSASSRIRSLISKKMSKKQDKKKKTSPLASKLQRTLSIHYLECNDYVLSDEMSSDSEASSAESNSGETESGTSSGHVTPTCEDTDRLRQFEVCGSVSNISHTGNNQLNELGNQFLENQLVLTEKLTHTKDTWLKFKSKSDAKGQSRDAAVYQSKDFMDMLDLFNINKELFHQISQDPNSVFAKHLPGKDASCSEMVLSKSGSFPGTAFSRKRRGGLSRFKHEGEGVTSSNSFVNQEGEPQSSNFTSVSSTNDNSLQCEAPRARMQLNIQKPDHAVMYSSGTVSNLEILLASPHGSNSQRDAGPVSSKGLKQRIQDLIQETKKGHQHISMDGLLHRIPYGHKVSGNVKEERLNLWDGPVLEKSVSANSRHYSKSFRRSRSLTESLDSYSRLLESFSFRESPKLPEELKLIQENAVVQDRKHPRAPGRVLSNPEYGPYPHTKGLPSGDGAVQSVCSYNPKPVDTIVLENDFKEANMFSLHTLASETIDEGLDETAKMNELDQNQNGISNDFDDLEELGDGNASIEHMVGVNDGVTVEENSEKSMLSDAHDHSRKPDGTDDLRQEESSNSFIQEQEVTFIEETCIKQIKPSTISVLNTCFEAEPASPSKYFVVEGSSEPSTGEIHCEGSDSFARSNGQSDHDNEVGVMEADIIKSPSQGVVANIDAFYVQVNKKDQVEFKYVQDLLKKSEFSGESLPREWYSPYPEVDHSLLHGEAECSNHDSDIARDDPEMSLDHQVRFNLINEVLADIYVRSFSYWPGFMHFNSRIRPLPTGYHVLEEVWGNISWHLGSQTQTSQNLDCVIARDFSTNDGWMNLRWDTECVALELEALIFDDLLHEAALDFNGLSISS
ncbi:hypothetical protein J5N97_014974 [Dioscorea zingiberensis]|uniref:DUF4378 domain-containing protein n=1 Tax=Dioscorea zingiberensis TaxID=325984 RepID=A0A9D5HK11_9LILI|nr:hypothetical protein J5N97_014974 [Dioscorea zingiberensis]